MVTSDHTLYHDITTALYNETKGVQFSAEQRRVLERAILTALSVYEKSKTVTIPLAARRDLYVELKTLFTNLRSGADFVHLTSDARISHYNEVWIAILAIDIDLNDMGPIGKPWEMTEGDADDLLVLVERTDNGPGRLAFTPTAAPQADSSLLG